MDRDELLGTLKVTLDDYNQGLLTETEARDRIVTSAVEWYENECVDK